mgnify:CR=1 FL=1
MQHFNDLKPLPMQRTILIFNSYLSLNRCFFLDLFWKIDEVTRISILLVDWGIWCVCKYPISQCVWCFTIQSSKSLYTDIIPGYVDVAQFPLYHSNTHMDRATVAVTKVGNVQAATLDRLKIYSDTKDFFTT